MSEWKRSTKEVSWEDLLPEMVSAIKQHIGQYNLGPILSDALMGIQTDSEKIKKGLFGGSEKVTMGAVVTPRWLVWSVLEEGKKATALSAQLINITVQDYVQTPFAQMVPDSGIQVSGIFTDAIEPASAFIGLDQSPAAERFREVIIQATQDAKK
ncbi:MAG TPA: hypothetical protein VK897_06610 [Anaerolineales bacterium]|nr:hypothetical protein [Anaerolineales bacterium]